MIDSFYISVLLAPVVVFALAFSFFTKGRTRPGWGPLIAGNLLILAVLLSSAILVGETYYRFVYDTTDSFAFTLTTRRWIDRHFELNDWGYRDEREYSEQREPGARRITILGDSFAAGHGVSQVGDRFANRVGAAMPEWDVHTLARPGANTRSETEFLREVIERGYELDLVVLAYGLNDASELTAAWEERSQQLLDAFSTDSFLLNRSYFLNTLYFRALRRFDPELGRYFEFVQDHYQGGNWEQLEMQFYTLESLVRTHGGKLVVVIFPFFHVMGADYPYVDLHGKIAGFWESLGVPTLDLLPVYREYAPDELVVNRYDAHPNAFAHRLAADALLRFAEEQLARSAQ